MGHLSVDEPMDKFITELLLGSGTWLEDVGP